MCGPIHSGRSSGNVIVRSGPPSPREQAVTRLDEAKRNVDHYNQRLSDTANNQKFYTEALNTAKEKLAAAQEHYDGIIKALDGGNV